MGFLDNIITAISPEAGYKREAWRQALEELRGYDAASHGRLNSGWRVFNESAELTDRYSRDVIRARARDLERNSDISPPKSTTTMCTTPGTSCWAWGMN